MSTSPPVSIISTPVAQISVEPSSPTEPHRIPTGGLGIEGVNIHLEVEHHQDDLKTGNRASTNAARKYLESQGEFGNDLESSPTVVQDGIQGPTSVALPLRVKR